MSLTIAPGIAGVLNDMTLGKTIRCTVRGTGRKYISKIHCSYCFNAGGTDPNTFRFGSILVGEGVISPLDIDINPLAPPEASTLGMLRWRYAQVITSLGPQFIDLNGDPLYTDEIGLTVILTGAYKDVGVAADICGRLWVQGGIESPINKESDDLKRFRGV